MLASAAQKALATKLGARRRLRFLELVQPLSEAPIDWEGLGRAAKLTANRAGLLVAGGVAPAMRALQGLKAPSEEQADLVRFAISDWMVAFRAHR